MNERLRQIARVGRLVGVGLAGSREEITDAALPVLEDAERQVKEHRRRRALNGAAVDPEPLDAGAVVTPPPEDPPPAPPRRPGELVLRRPIGGRP